MTDDPQPEAADADVKAMRPWHKNKAVVLPAAVMVLILALAAWTAGGSSDGDDSDKSSSSTSKKNTSDDETDAETNAAGSAKPAMQNGDWRLDSISVVKDKEFDGYSATGHFTYTGDDEEGRNDDTFTVTLFKDDKQVGLLNGVVYTPKSDNSVKVQFISADKYVKGPYKYEFQVQISGGAELPGG
jgi:hypothetical protein